ncbi:alpha/beta hydrolase [Solirubrobacter taibaiensis]|nr:alpha/beta hydrolase [Solirubrobacter taibaiensis]
MTSPVLVLALAAALLAPATARADTPCPPRAQCGTVTVPLDRADPAAGTLDVAYALVPRADTGRPALGTIVPNPGGPGSGAIAEAATYEELFAPLRERRDLLLIDPRGTGGSGALACPSLAARDPLTLDLAGLVATCGADLGPRANFYGAAATADDFEAVRAKLGIEQLDLYGQSYGTFLLPVYAARHPERVRSMVLSGAYPLAFDPWARDLAGGVRESIERVCRRTGECSGRRVLDDLARLAQRLRKAPVRFTAPTANGPVELTLGEAELAMATYGRGDPSVYGLLPAAVAAALDHDYALLQRLAARARLFQAAIVTFPPEAVSVAQLAATTCHDYPMPFDRATPFADRKAAFDGALSVLEPAAFTPFSASAWFQSGVWGGPACIGWPGALTGSPLEGRSLPDVPVLVQSGDLDTNTPVEQGRAAAAQFPRATFAVIGNAGHTPDADPCAAAMAIEFVRRLRTDANRCRTAGSPPDVVARPARRAAELAGTPARRAVAVALATAADAQATAELTQLFGTVGALRGGAYVAAGDGIRIDAARVVSGAVADGTLRRDGSAFITRLRVRGRAVSSARLTLRTTQTGTRITGTVAGVRLRKVA